MCSTNNIVSTETNTEKRRMCHGCPWGANYSHSKEWKEMVQRGVDSGEVKSKVHRCHSIDNDTWAETDESNVCIGSLNAK